MNAADERSLESIRQKVFPFIRVDWRTDDEIAPRFLILDECETLTEAAQLSLQTILNTDSRDMCVILICNSQSRIHPKLRQRLLKIRYDPPNREEATDGNLFNAITRGDLRQNARRGEMEERLWKYIHCHPEQIKELIYSEHVDYHTVVSEILLLGDQFDIMDMELIERINLIYPLLADTSLYTEKETQIITLIRQFKVKFDKKISNTYKSKQ